MTENFELLETGQIEIMHDQTHSRIDADGETDCDMLRITHDSLAAELVKRGLPHDTEVICPESELARKAPNYRRGFTDDICTNCAFGQLFPLCNLYKADYTKLYTCDSFRYFEVLELEPPHGFLMAQGKEIAIADIVKRETDKGYLIVSDGEAFGIAILDQPAQLKTKDFDNNEWQRQHRVTSRERRQWWPDSKVFYVYPVKEWLPFENGIKLYQDGKVVNEPELTRRQQAIVDQSKELPKQIILVDEAVSITEKETFIFNKAINAKSISSILMAAYDIDNVIIDNVMDKAIPVYSLALIRNPRMRVSKKNLVAEGDEKKKRRYRKQEDETVPFAVVRREDEYCVVNTDTEETMGCHDTEAEADGQLIALNINVDKNIGKPKKKPKKKSFIENLKALGKNISEFLASTEIEVNSPELFQSDVGIAQKTVNGELWHFTWSTNAFEDREGELFSTKSLEDYVSTNELSEHKGNFNLWHINAEDGHFNTDFAQKQWQGVVGRFLVEAGPYLENKQGQSAKQFFSEFSDGHPAIAPEGWGCSPEYKYLPEERATGIYENIWITRTSTLPRMDAANIWTETRQLERSKNMALTDKQMNAAVEIFGKDFVNGLLSEGENKTNELEAAGIAHKSNDETEINNENQSQEVTFGEEQFQVLAQEVAKQFNANNEPLIEALTNMANELQSTNERIAELENKSSAKELAEVPRFTFSLQRASENKEAIVTEDDKLKDQKPVETLGSLDPKTVTPGQFFNKPA